MGQIFISYRRKERSASFVKQLEERLKQVGFDVWIDTELLRPGTDWKKEIDNAIKASLAVLVVLTPESNESRYVTYEWGFALGRGMEVIPLLFEEVNENDLHPRLKDIQFIDFTNHFALEVPLKKLIDRLCEIETGETAAGREVPPFIQRAIDALDSYEIEDRGAAIERLTHSNHPAAVEALAKAVYHHLDDVREDAAVRLAQLTQFQDVRAVPGLVEALNKPKYYLRGAVIHALGEIGNREAVLGLIDALHHPETWEVSNEDDWNFLSALKCVRNYEGVSVLIEALNDQYQNIRLLATIALRTTKDRRAVPQLIRNLTDKNGNLRGHTIATLVSIGDETAVDAISSCLTDTDMAYQEDEYPVKIVRVCDVAVEALKKFGTSKALAAVDKWRKQQDMQ